MSISYRTFDALGLARAGIMTSASSTVSGNAHFRFAGLNNIQAADVASAWLTAKGLDN